MSHSIDQYLVFKDSVAKEFYGSHGRGLALEWALDSGSDRVWHYLSDEDTHTDISEDLANEWLNDWFIETGEVPAILPDFIKRHTPKDAIEEKRNQQLGRV